MRRFNLKRDEDVSGVSGIGIVAEGVEFDSGMCCMTWLSKYASIVIYPNIKILEAIHGHENRTKIVFID